VTKYRPVDVNRQVILYQAGEPSSEIACPTLGEAAIYVKKSRSKDDQERASRGYAGGGQSLMVV
jgi:hypothetical protein